MRLAAKARMGFYPAPLPVIDMIAGRLRVDPEAVLLDPCAGKGEAVRRLADRVGLSTSRVCVSELDESRSLELAEAIPDGIVSGGTDFLSAWFNGRPSLVYCNPPFDSEFGGGGRVETRFLSRVIHMMPVGGVLVFVGPSALSIRSDFTGPMRGYLEQVHEAPFPIEMRKYWETIWFGRKAKKYSDTPHGILKHKRIDSVPVFEVGAGELPTTFAPGRYTDAALCAAANASGAVNLLNRVVRRAEGLRPPLKLGKGHLALMLAGGHLNGVVRKAGRPPHVVRGTASKEEYTKSKERIELEESVVTKTTVSERICLTVRYVEPDGVIHTVRDAIAANEREESSDDAGN